MTTYGHFTLKGFSERRGDPYIQHGDQWYRITETYVIQGLDRVNYQAEECDPREPGRWQVEQDIKAEAAVADAEVARAREAELAAKSAEYHRQTAAPPLYEWAKTQGYGGRGRVSNELKRRYAEEFGLRAVPGQSSSALLLDDDDE